MPIGEICIAILSLVVITSLVFIISSSILETIPTILLYLGKQKRLIKAAYEDFKKK